MCSAAIYFMEMKASTMDHDNICNMDQAIFFYFYLRKFNCWIGFAAYFIHAVEKGKER